MKYLNKLPARQHGATLIVALIFLLVMTAAGITAMRFATFEERMTSNTQFSNQMFQQAQSELRSHMLEFNTNVALRAPLLLAKDQNLAPRTPTDLAANPTLNALPETARLPTGLSVKTQNIRAANNTVRFAVETLCPGSSAEKFTCLHFEMQTIAELGTANSWQTQGITYEAAKGGN
jgi:Tfp pilus assembly protein PilX